MFLYVFPKLPEQAREDSIHYPQKYGHAISVDHKVLNEENESPLQHRYAVEVQDIYFFD